MTLADEQNDRTTPDVIGRALVVAASLIAGRRERAAMYRTLHIRSRFRVCCANMDLMSRTRRCTPLRCCMMWLKIRPSRSTICGPEFPSDVIAWVEVASEVKQDASGQKLPWKVRKTEHLDRLNTAPWEVAAIVLADKIHNLRDITAEPREASYWAIFSASPLELIWYYDAVVAACLRQGRTDSLAKTASELVARMKRMIGGQ